MALPARAPGATGPCPPIARGRGFAWLWALLLLALAGCAAPRPAPELAPGQTAVELETVPFYPQQRYQCGPAALATVLTASGAPTSPERLVEALYIPARQGTLQPELLARTRAAGRLAYSLEPDFQAVLAELEAGRPVLVLQNLGLSWWPKWHYAVVVGYLPETRQVVLRSGTISRRLTPLDTFSRTWARGDYWAMVALAPGELPARGTPGDYLSAAFDLERGGKRAEAITAYRTALERWPEHAGLYLALANALYAEGDVAGAQAVLARAASLGLADARLYNNYAMVLSALGRHPEAESAALRAVELGAGARAYHATLQEVRAAAR